MRKPWLLALAALLLASAAVLIARSSESPATADTVAAADLLTTPIASTPIAGAKANLPAVFRPLPTPTPTITPTPTNTPLPTPPPTPPPTRQPNPSPTPGFGPNLLVNGSFEEGWTDLPPEGNTTNQEPNNWDLTWLMEGTEVWDPRPPHHYEPGLGIVRGVAEMIHKIGGPDIPVTLPIEEWMGGPNALILEGVHTYNMFHDAAAFGSQLSQKVTLPPGTYRLTVPVQLHWHEGLKPDDPTWDTFTAESGAWVLYGGAKLGDWATAREMGDRRWYYHVIEFTLGQQTEVEVRIRVKSIYNSPKDFFIDAVWLERIR